MKLCRVLRGAMWIALAFAARAHAAPSLPAACRDARFLVPGGALVSSDESATLESVTLSGSSVVLGSGCPAAAARLKTSHKGTRLTVTWRHCAGLAGKATLTGLVRSDCQLLDATFRAPRAKVRRHFRAPRSTCHDGTLDEAGGEACDDGHPCGDGGTCLDDCTCLPPGATTTTLPAPVCGNGVTEPPEQCDDGNAASGDGCSAACQLEGTLVTEDEPNSPAYKANATGPLPIVIRGRLSSAGDQDYFAFNTTAGMRVRLETFDSTGTGCKGIDTYLELCDVDGTSVLMGDDNDGIGTCSLVDSGVLGTGRYFARVLVLPGQPFGAYELHITQLAP
jgi:cysteine-rich repeat protein